MGKQRAICTSPAERKRETDIVKRMGFTGVKTYCR